MRLYHFTCGDCIEGIKEHGLTLGGLIVGIQDGKMTLARGWQWLTRDPDPRNQFWETKVLLKHTGCPGRLQYRLTIHIPGAVRHRVNRFVGMALPPEVRRLLAMPGDRDWYVFDGPIPPFVIERPERLHA